MVIAGAAMITLRNMNGQTWHYCESDGDITACDPCYQSTREIARIVQIPPAICGCENEPPENEEPDLVPVFGLRAATGWCAPDEIDKQFVAAMRSVASRSQRSTVTSPGWLSSDYRLTDYSDLDRVWIDWHWKLATDNGV